MGTFRDILMRLYKQQKVCDKLTEKMVRIKNEKALVKVFNEQKEACDKRDEIAKELKEWI